MGSGESLCTLGSSGLTAGGHSLQRTYPLMRIVMPAPRLATVAKNDFSAWPPPHASSHTSMYSLEMICEPEFLSERLTYAPALMVSLAKS